MQQDRSRSPFCAHGDSALDEASSILTANASPAADASTQQEKQAPSPESAVSLPRPTLGNGCNQIEALETPVQQRTGAVVNRDVCSPSWKERSSPLRALWKWGSGMSNENAADIITEELNAMQSAASGAEGDVNRNSIPTSDPPASKPAPKSSLSKGSLLPARTPAPLQVIVLNPHLDRFCARLTSIGIIHDCQIGVRS